MRIENRRNNRVPVNLAAKIDPGHGLPLRDCVVLDISETGARIMLRTPEEAPDEFTVLLTPSGTSGPRRHCRLIWRATGKVGVIFPDRDREYMHH